MSERTPGAPLSTADMVSATRREQPGVATAEMTPRPDREERRDEPQLTGQARTAERPPGPANGAAPAPQAATPADEVGKRSALLASDQANGYHTRWEEIQTGFVDEPRRAVEQADQLVAEVIKRIAEVFAEERGKLEGQWSRGDQVDTEALRMALRRYRSFFERLLAA